MNAYYNEHDRFAAEWLRGLIRDGRITPGVVDERDIRDVQPDELRGFVQCHFFAGIAGWPRALQLAGWPSDRPVWTGSCPCQPFSSAGKRAGFEDTRHLWPTWFRLIRECRPAVVFGEQVASTDGLGWFDSVATDLESEAYAVGAADLPAAGVGAPHRRQRLFFVAHAHCSGRQPEPNVSRSDLSRDGSRRTRGEWIACDSSGSVVVAHASSSRPAGREIAGGSGGSESRAEGPRGLGGQCEPARDGAAGAVVHADGPGRPGRDQGSEAARVGGPGALEASAASSVADSDRERLEERPQPDGGALEPGERASRRRDAGGCGDPRTVADATGGRAPADEQPGCGRGAEHGSAWRDLVWLQCSDGKARPTKPGLQPLAYGIPGRVGLIRGAGNAIVPQAAAAFIGAFLDSEG